MWNGLEIMGSHDELYVNHACHINPFEYPTFHLSTDTNRNMMIKDKYHNIIFGYVCQFVDTIQNPIYGANRR